MENVTEITGGPWGVLFEDSGREYLIAVRTDEDEAHDLARELDETSFERAMDKYLEDEAEEPDWEDFDGMHYVEETSSKLADSAREELARGFAVRVV